MKFGISGEYYINQRLAENLDNVKQRVSKKNWDYVGVIAGKCGVGKSKLAQCISKFLCPWFSLKYIAFTANDFIRICNAAPPLSAVVLDESFESLNSRGTLSPEFRKVLNHLQLIRQKHLYILLCIPSYWDLARGVALHRSSHLFVPYDDIKGNRGRFLAFGAIQKQKLYLQGAKSLSYRAATANFIGNFTALTSIDEKEYEKVKLDHLKAQNVVVDVKSSTFRIFRHMKDKLKFKNKQIEKYTGYSPRQVYRILREIA